MQKILIVGAGKSGLSAALFLAKRDESIVIIDDKLATLEQAFNKYDPIIKDWQSYNLEFTKLENIDWQTIKKAIICPGIPLSHPAPHPAVLEAKKRNIPIENDINIFFANKQQIKVVAITGTNGKSTTTALSNYMLNKNSFISEYGANIGFPALDLLAGPSIDYAVLELSSYQLELCHHARYIERAILLNITPDHIDRYSNLTAYADAKANIFESLTENGQGIISVDYPETERIYHKYKDKRTMIPFSLKKKLEGGISLVDNVIYDNFSSTGSTQSYKLPAIPNLPGKHNLENILAVITLLLSLGAKFNQKIIDDLLDFRNLDHRIELCGKIGEVNIYNDSKATNMDAASHALACFKNIIWLAGGKLKEINFEAVAPLLHRVNKLIAFGAGAADIKKHLAPLTDVITCHSLQEATDLALQLASQEKKGVILLSPGGASFDEFENFMERGNKFKEWVRSHAQVTKVT